jgi:hypothetical protein
VDVPLNVGSYVYFTFYSFIHQWLCSSLLGLGLFFSFVTFFTQTVGLLGRVISPSQCHYLDTEQYKHRINVHTDIHALSAIRTHDPSEDSSCPRPRGQCDRRTFGYSRNIRGNSSFILTSNEQHVYGVCTCGVGLMSNISYGVV